MRARLPPFAALALLLLATLPSAAPAHAGEPSRPYALAEATAFRGQIDYTGYRADDGRRVVVRGTLAVNAGKWSLDEVAPGYRLHADAVESYVRSGEVRAALDDPLGADGLVNAWTLALGLMSVGAPAPVPVGDSATIWKTPAGIVYTTRAGDRIVGLAHDGGDGTAFAFADWTNVDGMLLPRSILRLRRGIAGASFIIESYSVTRNGAPSNAAAPQTMADTGAAAAGAGQTAAATSTPLAAAFPWRQISSSFGLLMLGLCAVAWTRKDALTDRLCRRLAADPRGWRDVGLSLFVSPEGRLFCDGKFYRVGPEFFARPVCVQRSSLFLRVSADGASRVAVVPRKFRPLYGSPRAPERAAGFALIEILAATTLFVIVVVGAIYPALVATAHANQIAQRREAAVAVSRNVLSDEEAAALYDATAPGTVTTMVDGMTVTVTIAVSDMPGARDISVTVADPAHGTLARAVTIVGPPVPPPSDAPAGGAGR